MLLPSCGPFVLPAFFAYGFKERGKLLSSTMIFFAGFLVVFMAVGLGISFIANFFLINRIQIQFVAGILLLIFAFITLFGIQIRFLPRMTAGAVQPLRADRVGLFLFGMSFGLAAGGCTAPLLGSVFTIAAVSGVTLKSVALLFTFALGMIFPLILLSAFLDGAKIQRAQRWLVNCVFRTKFFGKTRGFPLTNIISAALFAFLGVFFLRAQASSPFASVGAKLGLTDFFLAANIKIINFSDAVPLWGDVLFLVVLAGCAILVWRKTR